MHRLKRKTKTDGSRQVLATTVDLCVKVVLYFTLPASLAHLRMDLTSLPRVVLHWARTAAALTPTVPALALTPQRNAVAVPALSATCASVLYVCGVANQKCTVRLKKILKVLCFIYVYIRIRNCIYC